MSRNLFRSSLVFLSTMLVANAFAAVRPHAAVPAATVSQPANHFSGPGGGEPNPDCYGSDCVVRAL